jgi:hypothetical protein
MPSLTRLVAPAVLLAGLAAGRTAHAEEVPREPPWDISLRAGYGTVFTSGVSYLNTGFGVSVGHTLGPHFRLEAVGLSSSGEGVRAENASIAYRSIYSSFRASLSLSYEARLGPVRLRPGIGAGVSVIDGHTTIGTTTLRDVHWAAIVGPVLESVVRVGHFEIGVAGEAFFVPGWPAAPTVGTYGIAGIVF